MSAAPYKIDEFVDFKGKRWFTSDSLAIDGSTLLQYFDTKQEARAAVDEHKQRVLADYWRSVPLPDGVVGLALSCGGYSARWYAGNVSERAATISSDGSISSRRLRDSAATVAPPGVHAWLLAQWELAKLEGETNEIRVKLVSLGVPNG